MANVSLKFSPRVYFGYSKWSTASFGVTFIKYQTFWGLRIIIEIYRLRITLATHKTVPSTHELLYGKQK